MIALLLFSPSIEARSAVLFSATESGAQLAANADVSFPTVMPTLNGTSLDFGIGAPADVLMTWMLLPASVRSDLHVEITLRYEELTLDNDPRFGISDGTNFQGGSRTDQGFFGSLSSSLTATEASNEAWDSWCGGLGSHSAVDSIAWEIDIAAGAAGPTSLSNYQEGSSFCPGPKILAANYVDVDQPLSFVLYRDAVSGTEQYRLESVSIVISDGSPPSPLPGIGFWGSVMLAAFFIGSTVIVVRTRVAHDRVRAVS
jgi:hypothetical protein